MAFKFSSYLSLNSDSLASGESARSEVESIKHGTVDGDPSHASFPVSVVVDETKENHLKANNNGSPFDHVQNSTEQLNVANGGGHGVPNGNSHKGLSFGSFLHNALMRFRRDYVIFMFSQASKPRFVVIFPLTSKQSLVVKSQQ